MRNVGVLVLSIFFLVEGAVAQGTVGGRASLAGDSAKALQDFKNPLSPDQWTALNDFGGVKPTQSTVCPNCQNVDYSQLGGQAFGSPEPGPGPTHLLVPIEEQVRLETINSTLWNTLNLLKGADKEYMGQYLAEEKAKAPTTLEQIALRTEYINSLVSMLGKSRKAQ